MDALPDVAYVYMVRCTGGQLYTGWTNHPAARLKAHQSGKGARYTRAHGAVGFAYLERCADKRAALRREAALKKLSKAEKEILCAAWCAAGCPGVENDLKCAPLSGCGTQHPHRALGGTCVLLAAAPTTPPCFRHWRRSSSLHSSHLQRNDYFYFAFGATAFAQQ